MSSSSYQVIQAGILLPATETGAQTCSTLDQAWLRRARMELLISAALNLFGLALSGLPSDMGAFGFCVDLRMLSCSSLALLAVAGLCVCARNLVAQVDQVTMQAAINARHASTPVSTLECSRCCMTRIVNRKA